MHRSISPAAAIATAFAIIPKQQLPPGHQDWSSELVENDSAWRVGKTLKVFLADFRQQLEVFRHRYPNWWFGYFDDQSDELLVWYIKYEPSYRVRGEWFPASLETSFWIRGRTPLTKGKTLTETDLHIPEGLVGRMLDTHSEIRMESKTIEPWAITYKFFWKNAHPQKKK